jgi:hypothetical protein
VQGQGALKITDSGKPWPPYHLWTFTLPRYQQYLRDLLEVHQTLEQVLAQTLAAAAVIAPAGPTTAAPPSQAAAAAAAADHLDGGSSSRSNIDGGSDNTAGNAQGPAAALRHFSADELQLQRGAAIQQDLQALQKSVTTTTTRTAAAVQQVNSEQGGKALTSSSSNSNNRGRNMVKGEGGLKATSTAVAYAKYVAQLGKAAVAAADDGDVAGRDQALLRLLANAYSVHVVHQAFGIRVGASATEKLGLFQKGAVALYTDYPEGVEDAQQRFRSAVDAAGGCLAPQEVQQVLEELPKAYTKNALLLGTMAQT